MPDSQPDSQPDHQPDLPPAGSLARRLLDAQVAHQLARWTGDELPPTLEALAEQVLSATGHHTVADLVDPAAIKTIVARALVTVPASAAVSGFVELGVAVARKGPEEPYPVGDLVDRRQVEVLVDELLALTPSLERALERLTASPLVGTMASRFMGRVVNEVLQANKAVADKLPGLGSLVGFGTAAATRMMASADKQLEGLIGETVGKGGTYAVRRLNRILVDTLQDPTTRDAILQVWDLAAAGTVRGTADRAGEDGDTVERADLPGVVGAVHDLTVTTLAHEQVVATSEAVVDEFFDRFGGYTPTELLDELDLERDDLVADLLRIAPGVVAALQESGDLERLLRSQLAPFWTSQEARDLLR